MIYIKHRYRLVGEKASREASFGTRIARIARATAWPSKTAVAHPVPIESVTFWPKGTTGSEVGLPVVRVLVATDRCAPVLH